MQVPKSKRWLDGYNFEEWPIERHIGWTVATAGPVDLDLEDQNVMFNTGKTRVLPVGYPSVLKAIVRGYAYTYDINNGVMKFPVELLRPWER